MAVVRDVVCDHSEVFDDYSTADAVCANCGLVMEPLYGDWNFRPGVKLAGIQSVKHHPGWNPDSTKRCSGKPVRTDESGTTFYACAEKRDEPVYKSFMRGLPPSGDAAWWNSDEAEGERVMVRVVEEREKARKSALSPEDREIESTLACRRRTEQEDKARAAAIKERESRVERQLDYVLQSLGMGEQDQTKKMVLENFYLLHSASRTKRRTTAFETRLLAFCTLNTIRRNGTPRPAEHVTDLLSIPNPSCVLQVEKALDLSVKFTETHPPQTYQWQEPEPKEYVETLGNFLRLDGGIASEAKRLLVKYEWTLYGKKPRALVGGAFIRALEKRSAATDVLTTLIVRQLHCGEESALRIAREIRKLEDKEEEAWRAGYPWRDRD